MILTFRYWLDIILCSCRNSRNREEYLSQTYRTYSYFDCGENKFHTLSLTVLLIEIVETIIFT